MTLLSEEGFLRGWLWAALNGLVRATGRRLVWSTMAFTARHILAVSPDTGFDIPAAEIPVPLASATLIGGVFNRIRLISGSVVAASPCHAGWNGLDYPLFGFSEKLGELGTEQTRIWRPEAGLPGIGLNLALLAYSGRKYVADVSEISTNIH